MEYKSTLTLDTKTLTRLNLAGIYVKHVFRLQTKDWIGCAKPIAHSNRLYALFVCVWQVYDKKNRCKTGRGRTFEMKVVPLSRFSPEKIWETANEPGLQPHNCSPGLFNLTGGKGFCLRCESSIETFGPSSSAAGQRCICTDDMNQWHGGFKPSLRNIVTKDMFLAVC